MTVEERLKEIETALSHNNSSNFLIHLMVISFGVSTAVAITKGSYLAVLCDFFCAMLCSVYVLLLDKEERELITEKESLLNESDQVLS